MKKFDIKCFWRLNVPESFEYKLQEISLKDFDPIFLGICTSPPDLDVFEVEFLYTETKSNLIIWDNYTSNFELKTFRDQLKQNNKDFLDDDVEYQSKSTYKHRMLIHCPGLLAVGGIKNPLGHNGQITSLPP